MGPFETLNGRSGCHKVPEHASGARRKLARLVGSKGGRKERKKEEEGKNKRKERKGKKEGRKEGKKEGRM